MSPWILAARPKTLPAAVMPVVLGCALADRAGAFEAIPAGLCLLFALLIQIGTNYANDYYDGIKGTDTDKRIGPQRAVATGLVTPASMKAGTVIVLGLAFLVGLALIPYGGWWLLGVGIASLICAVAYTGGPYPLGYHGWGDVFVIIFFGFIAVGFTYYVQAKSFSGAAWLAGLGMGLVVNNILIVNNYRDIDEDRISGKRTIVVRFGRPFAYGVYIGSYIVALIIPAILAALGMIAWWACLIVPVAMLPTVILNSYLIKKSRTAPEYGKTLAQTAKAVIFYGIAFSLTLVLG
ncbi:MAG: 1,4-dihydroxy-2-naphthoate polyprenyltransferase [Puniceicoccales bacterium]